jgi:outer membrane protein
MTPRQSARPVAQRGIHAVTALAALMLAAVAPRVYAQAARIGVVDMRRAITETNEGRAAADSIKLRYDARQTELDRRTKAIENLKARLEHPRAPIPPAKLQKMAQSYQQQVSELEQIGQQYSQELQQLEAELVKATMVKMQPILREIGQSDNYQIIVDERVVHFAPLHLNLTDRVIQLYNQRNPVAPGAARPAVAPAAGTAARDGGAPAAVRPVAEEPIDEPPPSASDAGQRALPSVFFRRDH